MTRPLNVLAVFACPRAEEESALRLDKEDRVLTELARSHHGKVKLEREHAAQIRDIHRAIAGRDVDVLHISAHGMRGSGDLLLESPICDEGQRITADLLARVAAAARLQVAVFLCCYTANAAETLANVAPFVIVSDGEVSDAACLIFVEGFYEFFFAGHSVRDSYDHARVLLASHEMDAEKFLLWRRWKVDTGDSLFVEAAPAARLGLHTIVIDLSGIRHVLDAEGVNRERTLASIARKLRIHAWIFDSPRESAIIPIGLNLFGEFSWAGPNAVVRCHRLFRLREDVSAEHWRLWTGLLIAYNDLASEKYRSLPAPAGPEWVGPLQRAVIVARSLIKQVRAEYPAIKDLGLPNVVPNVEVAAAELEAVGRCLAADDFRQAVSHMELALTNLHEVVDAFQPPAVSG